MGTKNLNSATDLITFTRASGGTFLGSNGLLQTAANNVPRIEYDATGAVKGLLIEEARTNIVANSGDISGGDSSVFNRYNTYSLPSGVTVPDGSTDARLLYPSSSGVARFIYTNAQTLTQGATQTSSIYMKASGVTTGLFYRSDGGGLSTSGLAWFDLSAGTVGTVVSGYTAAIEDVGNGWYRCSVSGVTLNGGYLIVGLADADNSTTVTKSGTDGILLWGAQAETGSFPTSHIPTTYGSTATRAADVAIIPRSSFGHHNEASTWVVEFTPTFPSVDTNQAVLTRYGSGYDFSIWSTSSGTMTAQFMNSASNPTFPITANQTSKIAVVVKNGVYLSVCVDGGSISQNSVLSNTTIHTPTVVGWANVDYRLGGDQLGHIKSIKYYPRRLTNTQLQELTT